MVSEPKIILKLFLTAKGETAHENQRNVFISLLILYFIIKNKSRNKEVNIAFIMQKLDRLIDLFSKTKNNVNSFLFQSNMAYSNSLSDFCCTISMHGKHAVALKKSIFGPSTF